MARLRERYFEDVVPALMKEFGYSNIMQVPRIDKVVVNMGMGEAIQNAKSLDAAVSDLSQITGQRPVVTRAKKSISTFKLRAGMPIGVKVTLRGPRMYEFLDRLFNVALARIRDFGGLSQDAFDGRGNYTVGIKEHVAFPEIDFDKVDRVRGLEATIVTTAKSDQEARKLLELLGLPFKKS